MHNVFAQRVGIWYKDSEWADNIFEQILLNIPVNAIDRFSKKYKEVDLTDGSSIKFVSANDSSRGSAFSKSFIQDGISYKTYQTIISPCTKPIHSESIIVSSFDDFGYWELADNFYWKSKQK